MFPSGITCPVPARPALGHAAVLEALRLVFGLRRAGGAGSKAAFPRCAACLRGGALLGRCRCGRHWPGKAAGLWCLTAEHSLPRLHFCPFVPAAAYKNPPARRSCWRIGSVCLIFFCRVTARDRGKHGHQPAQANAAHGQAGQQGLFRDAAAHQLKDGLRQFVAGSQENARLPYCCTVQLEVPPGTTAACTASPHKAARPAPPAPGRYSQAAPMPPG